MASSYSPGPGLPLNTVLNSSHADTSNHTYTMMMDNVTHGTPKGHLISLTVPAIMFASGVVGNLLAIIVLLRSSREHKQTVFYRLVGALAFTDLFGTTATSPVTLAVYANNLIWVGGDALCNYESFMLIFAGYSTILIVGAMAVDRFLAICYPFFYDKHITYTKATAGIFALWGFAAIMGCLPILGLGENINQFPGSWCFFTFTSSETKNQIFAYSYAIIALCVIGMTAVTNVGVTTVLLKMRRKAIRTMNSVSTKRNDSELQMMVLLLGIIIVFCTCWCPFMIRILINQINKRQVSVRTDLHALRLASLNQILDPWVYILFRKELFYKIIIFFKLKVFNRCKCFSRGNDESLYTVETNRNGIHRHKPQDNDIQIGLTQQTEDQLLMKEECNGNDIKENETEFQNGFKSHSRKYSTKSTCSRSSRKSSRSKHSPECESQALHEEGSEHGSVRNSLELKHSMCLFCLSNHPKTIVMSAISECKSMDNLNRPPCEQYRHSSSESKTHHSSDCSHGKSHGHMTGTKKLDCSLAHISDAKRDSIHLSLTDLDQERYH